MVDRTLAQVVALCAPARTQAEILDAINQEELLKKSGEVTSVTFPQRLAKALAELVAAKYISASNTAPAIYTAIPAQIQAAQTEPSLSVRSVTDCR